MSEHITEPELEAGLPPEEGLELRGNFTMDRPLPEGFPLDDDSVLRRIAAEPVGALLIGRALVAEVAHPMVAAAVQEHSVVSERPGNRYLATGGAALRLVFGNEQEAKAAAQRIYNVHDHIHGELPDGGGPWSTGDRYDAHDGTALLWVWATLVDNMRATQEYVRPFKDDEEQRFYKDAVAFANFFGIPESLIPPSVEDFNQYFDAMITDDTLASTPTSKAMVERMLDMDMLSPRIARLLRAMTVTSLDPRFKENLGISLPADEQKRADRLDRRIRKYYPRLPDARLGAPKVLMGVIRTSERVSSVKNRLLSSRGRPLEAAESK